MKAKDLAAFLMKHPEAEVVLDDTETEWYAVLKTGNVWNKGTVVSLAYNIRGTLYTYKDGKTLNKED